MKNSSKTPSLNLELLVDSIDAEFIKELVKADKYNNMENKEHVLKFAKKLLVECDDIDEEICIAVDYLQCQVDHIRNQEQILSVLRHRERLTGEYGEIRYMFHELRDSLMDNIRYGKRTERIDEVLHRLGEVISMTNQLQTPQLSINFAGIENALSPRCSNCSTPCISAFRKVQVFLLKLIKVTKATYEANSNSQTQ